MFLELVLKIYQKKKYSNFIVDPLLQAFIISQNVGWSINCLRDN